MNAYRLIELAQVSATRRVEGKARAQKRMELLEREVRALERIGDALTALAGLAQEEDDAAAGVDDDGELWVE